MTWYRLVFLALVFAGGLWWTQSALKLQQKEGFSFPLFQVQEIFSAFFHAEAEIVLSLLNYSIKFGKE